MHPLTGSCHCGNIRVELELTRSPESFHPRACDCDFCSKHAAAWISDPDGSLRIQIGEKGQAARYRQGSALAELIFCGNCGILVCALHRGDGSLHAAVNARVFGGRAGFGSEQTVSPKTLSDQEKLERWRHLWFSTVRISTAGGATAGPD